MSAVRATVVELWLAVEAAKTAALQVNAPIPTHVVVGACFWDALVDYLTVLGKPSISKGFPMVNGLVVLPASAVSPPRLLAFGIDVPDRPVALGDPAGMTEGGW